MGHEDDRETQPCVESGQFLDGHRARHRVERGEGLVEEEDAGLKHDRAGDRGPLPLAPRERGRAPVGEVADLEARKRGPGLVSCLADLYPPRPQAERDVLEDGEVGGRGRSAGGRGRRPAPRGGGEPDSSAPVAEVRTGRDGNETGNGLEEGGLARPRRADDCAEGAGGEIERDGPEGEIAETDGQGIDGEAPAQVVGH